MWWMVWKMLMCVCFFSATYLVSTERTLKKKKKVCIYLGRCSILPMLQWERLCVWAAQAPEGHPGTQRSNIAHSDHCSLYTHQSSEHAGPQRPQMCQRLVVIQPADDVHKDSHRPSWAANVQRSGKQQIRSMRHLALMWGMLMIGVATGSSSSCSSAACLSKSIVNTWNTWWPSAWYFIAQWRSSMTCLATEPKD